MAVGAIPHYTTVFIKVGIRLLRPSESTARSGCVRLLREDFLDNCLLFVVWGWILYFPTTNLQSWECAWTTKSQNNKEAHGKYVLHSLSRNRGRTPFTLKPIATPATA